MNHIFISRNFFFICLLLLLVSFCSCSETNTTNSVEDLEEITYHTDTIQRTYTQLKKRAGLIAKVVVTDSLSTSNSIFKKDPEDGNAIYDAYSLRTLRILDVLGGKNKSDFKSNDSLKVIDAAAVDDSYYIHPYGYEKLKKGSKYILFLGNNTESGKYSIIGDNNGRIDLASVNSTDYYEISVKGIIEYESETPASDVKKIVNSSVIKTDSFGNNKKSVSIEEIDAIVDYEFVPNNRTRVRIIQ